MKIIKKSILLIAVVFSLVSVSNNFFQMKINNLTAATITCSGPREVCYEEFYESGAVKARVYGDKAVIEEQCE